MWDDYGLVSDEVEQEDVSLPYRYRPRHYQQDLISAFFDMLEGHTDIKQFAVCWHRRAGKDVTFWQCVVAAAAMKVGDYVYTLPQQNQATRVIWNGNVNDSDGLVCKFKDFIPPSLLAGCHKQEMRFELTNGSNIYVLGSDNYEGYVGGNASGIVYSEWSITNPKAQEYFKPMVRQNNGWEMFCFTPRGKNHAYDTLVNAEKESNKHRWYVSKRDISQTFREDMTTPVISPLAVMDDIADGMDEAIARQEYYLDFNAAVKGIIFGKELELARSEGRVCKLLGDTSIPVDTYWDLGISKGNATTCWLVQVNGLDINLIGYFEAEDEPLSYFLSNGNSVGVVNQFLVKNGLSMGKVYLPHDGNNRDLIAGEKRSDTLRGWGYKVHAVPRISDVKLGIEQTKRLFSRFKFDSDNTFVGLQHLERYRYKVDKTTGLPTSPVHDEASNCADALRQLGQSFADEYSNPERHQRKVKLNRTIAINNHKNPYSVTGQSGYNPTRGLY